MSIEEIRLIEGRCDYCGFLKEELDIDNSLTIEESFLSMNTAWIEYDGYTYCSTSCKSEDNL